MAQESLSLQQCYDWVQTHYPLAKQQALLNEQHTFDQQSIGAQRLPQLQLAAQATYQSDVVEIPIPNPAIEPINKDQYKATLTVNQLIYSGGSINAASRARIAELNSRQKQLEVNLYQLKKEVNQLYFSVLLLQQQQELIRLRKDALQARYEEVQSAVNNGTALASSAQMFEVELLKIDQRFAELDQNRNSLLQTLSLLTAQNISPTVKLQPPAATIALNNELKRPELELFELKKAEIESNEKLLSKQNLPQLAGFATGGYGNPGLNFLDNSFQTYYIVGVQLQWKMFDWNANRKKRASLAVNRSFVDNESEVFRLKTEIELQQQLSEIEKLESIILSDQKIIVLQQKILKSAESQQQNGQITHSAYLEELTKLYEQENQLKTHQIQLQLTQANYSITKGE